MKIKGSKNKHKKPSTLPNKTNILKLKLKSTARKRTLKKDKLECKGQLFTSLGCKSVSYIDSSCGIIECVETDGSSIKNQTKNVSLSSFNSSTKNKRDKSKKCHIINNIKVNHQFPCSTSNNSIMKTTSDNSTISNGNSKCLIQLGLDNINSDRSFSPQGLKTIPPSSSSVKVLKNEGYVKRKKREATKEQNAGNYNQPSSLCPQNSLVKMTCVTKDSIRGNTILDTLCSDNRPIKSDKKGFSLLESLMLSGSPGNETSTKGYSTKKVVVGNELYDFQDNRKYSMKNSRSLSQPKNTEEITSRKVHDLNKPVCSIVKNSKDTNLVAIFYELGYSNFIVLMKPESNIAIIGTVEIQILNGSIEILGYNLNREDKKLLIFSLHGSSHLSLKAKDLPLCEGESNKNLCEKLIGLGLSEDISRKVSKKAEGNILFTVNRNKKDISSNVWPRFLETHLSFSIFPNTQFLSDDSRSCHIVERKIKCLFETNLQELGLKEFNEISEWSAIVNDILTQDYPKAILCGGKSVGKSSLLRYLVNKCLSKWKQILVLDFDLGQCEFTVPGCISATLVEDPLLGPNYSHLKEPVRSVFLGEVDVTKCPENYIGGSKSLIEYAHSKHSKIPWLINTMGFTKGFGVSLACGIINYVSPTNVIQIQSKDRKLNFPSLLEPKFVNCLKHSAFDVGNILDYQLSVIPSGNEHLGYVSKSRGISPAESRNLVILSYMSKMLNSNMTSLSQVTPYKISMKDLDLQTTNKYSLTRDQVAATMNGNMVALCHKKPFSQYCNCRGFGIVRAVDWKNGTIYLIAPLPITELNRVNCLVKGNVGLPDSLYYNQGDLVTGHVPYLAHTSGGSTARFTKRDFRSLPVTQSRMVR